MSGFERYKMIEVAAYYLAEKKSFAGNSTDYWVAAEAQIKKMLAKQLIYNQRLNIKLAHVLGALFVLSSSLLQAAPPVSWQVFSLIPTPQGNATYTGDKQEGCNWVFEDGSKLEALIYYGADKAKMVASEKQSGHG